MLNFVSSFIWLSWCNPKLNLGDFPITSKSKVNPYNEKEEPHKKLGRNIAFPRVPSTVAGT